MKNSYLLTAIVCLIVVVAIFTNPTADRHKEVIRMKLNEHMQSSFQKSQTQSNDQWERAGQAIGLMLGGLLVDKILDNIVSVENYVLFSTTKISWQGETKVIGIGAFGNVFITNKLDEALNNGLFND